MNLRPMADALAPLRSQMQQKVHEREILRVFATVQGHDAAATMDTAKREALAWTQNRSGGQLPQEAWDGQSFEFLAGGRTTLGTQIDGEDFALWAVRGDDPDKTVPRRTWTTEITLGRQGDGSPQISLRLLVGTPEAELSISLHVPGGAATDRGELWTQRGAVSSKSAGMAHRHRRRCRRLGRDARKRGSAAARSVGIGRRARRGSFCAVDRCGCSGPSRSRYCARGCAASRSDIFVVGCFRKGPLRPSRCGAHLSSGIRCGLRPIPAQALPRRWGQPRSR